MAEPFEFKTPNPIGLATIVLLERLMKTLIDGGVLSKDQVRDCIKAAIRRVEEPNDEDGTTFANDEAAEVLRRIFPTKI